MLGRTQFKNPLPRHKISSYLSISHGSRQPQRQGKSCSSEVISTLQLITNRSCVAVLLISCLARALELCSCLVGYGGYIASNMMLALPTLE